MKKLTLTIFIFLQISFLMADLPTRTTDVKSLELPKPVQKPEELRPQQPKAKPERLFSTFKPIGSPGIVAYQDGRWVGSDYLGHLTTNVGVAVEIVPAGTPAVSEAALLQLTSDLFKKQGLNPNPLIVEGDPPLPFLHFLVMLYTNDGENYIVFTATRLFENVKVMREKFEPYGYWQAVTWENQFIEATKREQLASVIATSVQDSANVFLTRYREYNPHPLDVPGGQSAVVPQGIALPH